MATSTQTGFLPSQGLWQLVTLLQQAGYRVLAPTAKDGAIQYLELDNMEQLPWGVRQSQAPGEYRLQQQGALRAFAWANGPQALKPALFAPTESLWRVSRDDAGTLHFTHCTPSQQKPLAALGVRPCDLAALAIHDKHFFGGEMDPHYAARRDNLLLISVNCSHPADTCFCASTGDGPVAEQGYDLSLDELDDGFVVRPGSEAGHRLFQSLSLSEVSDMQVDAVNRQQHEATAQQRRALPGTNLQQPLFANLEHPRWQDVGERCLACGNCTSVCPTCFCHNEEDVPALDGSSSEHIRQWDSCFSQGHSYIHGKTIRAEIPQRYRQWLTHKLGSWHEQFGRSGCVGCGRCISWCPVGIDITEEANAICGGNQ